MMKFFLPFMIFMFFCWEIKVFVAVLLMLCMLSSVSMEGPVVKMVISESCLLDYVNFYLILLTMWLSVLMVIISVKIFNSYAFYNMIMLLMISLLLSFSVSSLFLFYFFFEWSLIPIFMIIMGWGYQPERMRASILLFFYTLFASLPLLMVLLLLMYLTYIFSFQSFFLLAQADSSSWAIMSIMAILAFVVKFPVYFVHLWLPKAHVEAPVAGSMILAGVLLKLGGYGILRLAMIFSSIKMIYFLSLLTMWGGGLLSVVCMRISDMKVLIAYSSVVHMSLVLVGVVSHLSWGVNGAMVIMVAHGLCSSGMFAWANMSYERSHSRSLMLNKGSLVISPMLGSWWFILMVCNFSGPFTLNLVGEIMLIINVFLCSKIFWLAVAMLSFFSAAYSLVMYSSTQQGVMISSNLTSMECLMMENIMMFSHVWPLYLMIVSAALV